MSETESEFDLKMGVTVTPEEYDLLVECLTRPGAPSEAILRGQALLRKLEAQRREDLTESVTSTA